MTKKKVPTPEIDYKSLWGTYDRWQQEDKMWYDTEKARQEKGEDVARETVKMASSGMQRDSEAWKAGIERVKSKRPDIDKQYADKQKDLKQSLVYEDLQEGWKRSEQGRMSNEADQFMGQRQQELERMARGARGDERMPKEQRRELERLQNFGGSRGGKVSMAASAGMKFQGQSFQEWGEKQFGSQKAENPYAEAGPTKEQSATARAKAHSKGRQKGAGTDFAIAAFEENPWML